MAQEVASPSREWSVGRWGDLGAIVYVLLFVVGFVVAFHGQPSSKSVPATLIV